MTPTNPIPEGMKAWHGGAKPFDWSGEAVKFRSGEVMFAPVGAVWKLGWDHSYGDGDIIAYTPKPTVSADQALLAAFIGDGIIAGDPAPTPHVGDSTAIERIFVRWSDDGQHIRKWSRSPFEGGAPVAVHVGEHLAVAKGGDGLRDADGYATAFYELADLMDIPARPRSPAEVWRDEMLPRLRAALAERPAMPMPEGGQ